MCRRPAALHATDASTVRPCIENDLLNIIGGACETMLARGYRVTIHYDTPDGQDRVCCCDRTALVGRDATVVIDLEAVTRPAIASASNSGRTE